MKGGEKEGREDMMRGWEIGEVSVGYDDRVKSVEREEVAEEEKFKAAAEFRMVMEGIK